MLCVRVFNLVNVCHPSYISHVPRYGEIRSNFSYSQLSFTLKIGYLVDSVFHCVWTQVILSMHCVHLV